MPNFAKRFFRYYYLRLVRQSGSPDYIARGVAIGLFIGMIIPMGGQLVVALALAYILKAHKLPALACTWITNHFTIGIIYPVQCFVGSYFTSAPLTWEQLYKIFSDFIAAVKAAESLGFVNGSKAAFHELIKLGGEVLVPFFIGGALIGTVLATLGYFLAYGLIAHHRMKVDMRIKKKLARQSELFGNESQNGA